MQTVYIGNTLINDVMLGSQRMDDVIQTITLPVDILIVASGGGGGSAGVGNNNGSGGGAGAGRYLSASFSLIQTGTAYSFTIGSAGTGGSNGGDATAFGVTCTGGGSGGGTASGGNSGGSGGGASVAVPSSAGNATSATGNYGIGYGVAGATSAGFPSTLIGGNGGGAGGTFAGSTTPKSWLDGINYAEGGYAGRQSHTQSTLYGSGGDGADVNLGTTTGNTGVKGIIKLRYAGSGSQATGGQISFSGGYTYHTFTASGTFTY
jgi:hypothetical protein